SSSRHSNRLTCRLQLRNFDRCARRLRRVLFCRSKRCCKQRDNDDKGFHRFGSRIQSATREYEAPSTGLTSALAFQPSQAPHRAHGAADAKRNAMSAACPRRMVKRPTTRKPSTIDGLVVGCEV